MRRPSLTHTLLKIAHRTPELQEPIADVLASIAPDPRTAARGKYLPIKDLPPTLAKALKNVLGYNKRDIEVITSPDFEPPSPAFEGSRSFVLAVNLETGATNIEYGSWGGASINSRNRIDYADKPTRIPPNSVAVVGESGGRGMFARVYVSPDNVSQLLETSEVEELTKDEKNALILVRTIKPGYRAEEMRRRGIPGEYNISNPIYKSLEAKGLIKTNVKGSISVTTEGKNYPVPNHYV